MDLQNYTYYRTGGFSKKMFTFKQNRLIKQKILDYLATSRICLERFDNCINIYKEQRISDEFIEAIHVVFKTESKADDLRREIEEQLYRKSLLPELRKDILMLIDQVDKLPNKAESILRAIHCQNIIIPQELEDFFVKLAALGVSTAYQIFELVDLTLGPCPEIQDKLAEIDQAESEADDIENEAIFKIFRSDFTDMEKILFRDLFQSAAHLSDLSQGIGDTVTLVNIKRHI